MSKELYNRIKEFQKLCLENVIKIVECLTKSWDGIDFINNNEPDIIKSFLCDKNKGIDFLNKRLAPIFNKQGFVVKFASVFVHQKPRITRIEQGDECELGDLLVIFSLVDREKNLLQNRAIIMQAKKNFKIDNPCQKNLYENDNGFRFPNSLLGKSCYSLPEREWPSSWANRIRGLQYLIFQQSPNTHSIVRLIPFDAQIDISWSNFFWKFLLGIFGHSFSRVPCGYRNYNSQSVSNSSKGWSSIIWDLINVVGESMLNNEGKRGRNINYLREMINTFNKFDNYHKYTKLLKSDDKIEALPIMLIIIQDKTLIFKKREDK